MWAFAGIALGIGGALAFGQALSGLLFGVAAADPVTIATVILVLAGEAAAACGFPTRQATKVDPAVALRHEQNRIAARPTA
jgi:hypothetical protein